MKDILITSSVLIPVILLLRFLFRRSVSRRVQYALWLMVLLRLLIPVTWGAREVGSPCEWRGGARHCSRAMVGESGLETC